MLSLRPGYDWDSFWTKHYWRVADGSKITLPAPKKINRVVVHAYYSKPRVRYGPGDALIQVWDASHLAWLNAERVNDGFISYSTPNKPKNGRYDFTFLPIETDQNRILVTCGDPKSMKKHQHVDPHWVRIVDVEVTGEAPDVSK